MLTQDDRPRFFHALAAMGVMFSDELTQPRQKLYWESFRDRVTVQEWEYACAEAIGRETFHKVPLPAHLWTYVEEYRQGQARRREQEERQQAEAARLLREAERVALEASPAWQAEQQALREESLKSQQGYEAWKATLSPEDLRLFNLLNPPRAPYIWQGVQLADAQLHYQPQGDPVEAKRKARAYLQHLMSEERNG